MNSNEDLWIQLQKHWLNSQKRTGRTRRELQKNAAEFFKTNKKDPQAIRSKITQLIWANKRAETPLAIAFAKQLERIGTQPKASESTEPEPPESVHVDAGGINISDEEGFDIDFEREPFTSRKRKKPAQEKCELEIAKLNAEIVSMQERPLMSTNDPKLKKIKKLKSEQERKLKRLQRNEVASSKFRMSERRVKLLMHSDPTISCKLPTKVKMGAGRPRVEDEQPLLLKTICEIASLNGVADERRSTETIRMCRTLDDLRQQLLLRGFNLSRSALYYRLLPANVHHIDGKNHVKTVPVKLARAQNDMRKPHEDTHFAAVTVKHVRDLATLMGTETVAVISQDDKSRVPLGLAAAKIQSPILMHLEYKVRLPDHDWVVGSRHRLIPSVYAALDFTESGELSYSGPTYIAIRSGKHDKSTAESHSIDFEKITELESFKSILFDGQNQMKPVLITLVDGGPDENPRYPKKLAAIVAKFRRYNFDAIFCVTHAPHQSASNPVERRMAPLSKDLAGIILDHETCGKHLDSNGKTIDTQLEIANFQKAGEALAEVWSESVIDGYTVTAEYIPPPISGSDSIGADSRDEVWNSAHIRQSKYFLQVCKCNNSSCCTPKRTNIDAILGGRFFPTPILFKRSAKGLEAADPKDNNKSHFFGDLWSQISLKHLAPKSMTFPQLPYDFYCPTEQQSNLAAKYCLSCEIFFPSAAAANFHKRIHRPGKSFVVVLSERESIIEKESSTCHIIKSLRKWSSPVFNDDPVANDEETTDNSRSQYL